MDALAFQSEFRSKGKRLCQPNVIPETVTDNPSIDRHVYLGAPLSPERVAENFGTVSMLVQGV
jgi:hypothetical protein